MINYASPKKNILLVDDEKNLTQTLSMLLETRGYSVQVANNATEALETASPKFDLVILDLVLPDIHGFEVCRRLRQADHTKNIPIIMISAHSLYEDRVQGLYLGADDFLPKPCEHEELFARIEVVLRHGQMHYRVDNTDNETIFELRRILDESLIVPHFQPIYSLNPFGLYGLEVLTRPAVDGPLANPEHFFKCALHYGLYDELELLAWTKAINYLGKELTNEKIFLNCNPYFIESSQFLRVRNLMEKNHIRPQNVVLELTERSAITDFDLFFQHLATYREYGFKVAVDDVGGGYASLQSIVETRPDIVKIDRHFVTSVLRDPFKISIVKFVTRFCQENHILCIAEGIESKEDFETVRALGVDAGQGYYFCRPTKEFNPLKFSGFRV